MRTGTETLVPFMTATGINFCLFFNSGKKKKKKKKKLEPGANWRVTNY